MKILKVQGVTCGYCEASVLEALAQAAGVEKVAEGSPSTEALIARITQIGFEPEVTG